MKRHVAGVLIVGMVTLSGSMMHAQQPAPPQPAQPAQAPQPVQAPQPPARPTSARGGGTFRGTTPAVMVAMSDGGQTVNIRLDVSINDQVGPTPAQPKLVTLLLADRTLSQLRTNFDDRVIRMDARPTIVDGKIKLALTMESSKEGFPPMPNIATGDMSKPLPG